MLPNARLWVFCGLLVTSTPPVHADAAWITLDKYELKDDRYIWREGRSDSLERNGPWVFFEQRSRLVTEGVPESGPGLLLPQAVNCLTGAAGATSHETETESGEVLVRHVTLEEIEGDIYSPRVRIGSGSVLERFACDCNDRAPMQEPSEERLRYLFEKYYEQQRTVREWRMLYIRTDSYETAREVVKRLDAGEPFEDLVRKYSLARTEFPDGDLGLHQEGSWSRRNRPLLRSLEVGEYNREPVDGIFGYEIYLKKEKRDVPPSYERSREAIRLFAIRAQQCRWEL